MQSDIQAMTDRRSTATDNADVIDETVARRPLPPLWKHTSFMVGAVILVLILVMTIFAPLIATSDPIAQDPNSTFLPPSAGHILGADQLGRDMLARVLNGGRWTIAVSIVATLIATSIGTVIGLAAGYLGGLVDSAIMRVIDLLLAFPGLLLALAIATITGPGLTGMTIAIGVSLIPGTGRIIRGVTLQARSLGYVEAAYSLGASPIFILRRHILPNIVPQVVVLATTGLGIASLSVATLGFLGLGLQPPTPEWGAILNDGSQYVSLAWWITFFPGTALSLYVIAVNLLGDGLSEILDPTISVGMR